jgi:hypothetical protein
LVGVAKALRSDLSAGYLQSLVELEHASTFADYLDMAEHLLGQGYKDAAAVVVGATLEAHLRALCHKYSVELERVLENSRRVPLGADAMNAELARRGAIEKLDQKAVTTWCDLRNNAAHGHYTKYTTQQVELMIAGVRDFVRRTPA